MTTYAIGFDIDGVLANFGEPFAKLAHDMFGTPEVDHWNIDTWHWLTKTLGLPVEDEAKVWNAVTPEWWGSLPVLCAGHELRRIRKLAERDDTLVWMLTNRHTIAQEATRDWLDRNGLGATVLHHTGNKGRSAQKRKMRAFIDDAIPNVEDLLAHGVPTCVRTWGYNKDFVVMDHSQAFRVGSIDEYFEVMSEELELPV